MKSNVKLNSCENLFWHFSYFYKISPDFTCFPDKIETKIFMRLRFLTRYNKNKNTENITKTFSSISLNQSSDIFHTEIIFPSIVFSFEKIGENPHL